MYVPVERTGPSIPAALSHAPPAELPDFEAEFRIALAPRPKTLFDLTTVIRYSTAGGAGHAYG